MIMRVVHNTDQCNNVLTALLGRNFFVSERKASYISVVT